MKPKINITMELKKINKWTDNKPEDIFRTANKIKLNNENRNKKQQMKIIWDDNKLELE